MNRGEQNDDEMDPRMKLRANVGDKLHDLQFRRDLAIINARTARELGPLPAGGVPVVPKRKVEFPVCAMSATVPTANEHQENETMDFKSMAVSASMALAGCTPMTESSQEAQGNRSEESRKNDSPMQAHKFRLNPDPKRRYDITLTIRDAPGPFDVVGFGAHYYADCWYVIDKFAGALGQPRYSTKPEFKKIDEATYVVSVYLDSLIDEDYYGGDVCHWRLNAVSAGFAATANDKDTRFSVHISSEKVVAGNPETTYFWKDRYPRSMTENFPSFGQKDRGRFAPGIKDDDLFTITLTSQQVQP